MSIAVPEHITVIPADVSVTAKTFQLPSVALSVGRIIIFYDYTGACSNTKRITIQCASGDVIYDGVSTNIQLKNAHSSVTVMAVDGNKWNIVNYFNGTFP